MKSCVKHEINKQRYRKSYKSVTCDTNKNNDISTKYTVYLKVAEQILSILTTHSTHTKKN